MHDTIFHELYSKKREWGSLGQKEVIKINIIACNNGGFGVYLGLKYRKTSLLTSYNLLILENLNIGQKCVFLSICKADTHFLQGCSFSSIFNACTFFLFKMYAVEF